MTYRRKGAVVGRRAFVTAAVAGAALATGPLSRVASADPQSLVEQQPASGVLAQSGVSEEEGIIVVRQPAPYDIIDNPIQVAGIATAFEGVLSAHLRDAAGRTMVQREIRIRGANGLMANFQDAIAYRANPSTSQGTLALWTSTASGLDQPPTVEVPIIFGWSLVNGYEGFLYYRVRPGDTLRRIAASQLNDANRWRRIYEANRHRISNPSVIRPGQVLRLPMPVV